MPEPFDPSAIDSAVRRAGLTPVEAAAAGWVQRIHDGLTLEEDIAFADWLAGDPAHEAAYRRQQAAWQRFEPLAQASLAGSASSRHAAETDPLLPTAAGTTRPRRTATLVSLLGLAAVIALLIAFFPIDSPVEADALGLPPPCEQLRLADGSVVELNRGARVTVNFSPNQRRLRLERGEASFQVARDPSRPFVVEAGSMEVRAIGTVFNVRIAAKDMDVLVTEGRVQVAAAAAVANAGATASPAPDRSTSPPAALLGAGQLVLVDLDPAAPPPEVRTLHPREIEARLAWQPKLLEFDDAPLSAIVGEFNRRNPVRLVIRDPAVAERRMTLSFRSDNLAGFVRLLEDNIGVRAQRIDEGQIALVRP